jgi:glucokinase-like ROK family protein
MVKQKANPKLMKEINEEIIVDLLKKKEPLSRAEIAKLTGLSRATVSSIVNRLVNTGLIKEIGVGKAKSNGGRKPVLLELNPEAFYIVGVDLGTNNIIAIVTDLKAKIKGKVSIPTEVYKGLSGVLANLEHAVSEVISISGIKKTKIIGMGMAVAGLIDTSNGEVIFSPNFSWSNVPIKKLVEERLNIPTYIDNCTRVMALGEITFGSARGRENLLYINVGYGIGSAIVIEGKVYPNISEIGHIPVVEDGPKCGCGKRGCLEAVSSGSAIETRAKEILESGKPTLISELANGQKDKVTAKIVAKAAENGDQVAIEIFNNSGWYLGKGIATAVNLLSPELVVIGGGVSQAGEILFQPVRKGFEHYAMEDLAKNVKIIPSGLGLDAGVIGAIALVLKNTMAGPMIVIP